MILKKKGLTGGKGGGGGAVEVVKKSCNLLSTLVGRDLHNYHYQKISSVFAGIKVKVLHGIFT